MNNPGIDQAIWERLRKKWTELQAAGHKIEIEYRLIHPPEEEETILAIDVVQKVDEDIFTETVQGKAEEANTTFGISGLSMEGLVETYKEILYQYCRQGPSQNVQVTVSLSLTSPVSGELRATIEDPEGNTKKSLQVNYKHYYLLNAIRGKMVELLGDGWQTARAVYRSGGLEFYFEY
jgi:hypothetical protein